MRQNCQWLNTWAWDAMAMLSETNRQAPFLRLDFAFSSSGIALPVPARRVYFFVNGKRMETRDLHRDVGAGRLEGA